MAEDCTPADFEVLQREQREMLRPDSWNHCNLTHNMRCRETHGMMHARAPARPPARAHTHTHTLGGVCECALTLGLPSRYFGLRRQSQYSKEKQLYLSRQGHNRLRTPHDNVRTGGAARPNRDIPPGQSFISFVYNTHTHLHKCTSSA